RSRRGARSATPPRGSLRRRATSAESAGSPARLRPQGWWSCRSLRRHRGLRFERQREPERAAAERQSLSPSAAAVQHHDRARNGDAEAHAARAAFGHAMLELGEDALLVAWWQARAVVLDRDYEPLV